MKRTTILLLSAVAILSVSACTVDNASFINVSNDVSIQSNENDYSQLNQTPPPTQPILFENFDAMLEFLHYPDFSGYPQTVASDYEKMISTINAGDYLYEPRCSIATRDIESVCLYPSVSHEDIGVGYYMTYLDTVYRVYVYTVTDDENVEYISKDLPNYWKARMGSDIFSKFDVNVDGVETFIYQLDDFIMIGGFLNSTQYFIIRTSASYEDLTRFAENLEFETIVIKQ